MKGLLNIYIEKNTKDMLQALDLVGALVVLLKILILNH